MPRYTPQTLNKMYDQGFSGAIWEQEHFDKFVSTLKYPLFGDASSRIKNSGRGLHKSGNFGKWLSYARSSI